MRCFYMSLKLPAGARVPLGSLMRDFAYLDFRVTQSFRRRRHGLRNPNDDYAR
jgi:hypothetical protein